MEQRFKLVAIGASAGGLDAIIGFFKSVPADCRQAFLVIQHLSPDHASMMDELLAPHTKLPVIEGEDGMQMEPGNIYLCPSGVIPRVNGMRLELDPRPKSRSVILPINIAFESMARTMGREGIAIILSGTGSDGSASLRSVAQAGGLVAVQEPSSAEFNGMPQSAISTGVASVVAPAKALWSSIDDYLQGSFQQPSATDDILTESEEAGSDVTANKAYREIFVFLDEIYGINFSLYRINSIGRRLQRRMTLLGIETVQAYFDYLKKNSDEIQSLYQDLLIGVTSFFRDSKSFAVLDRKVLGGLMRRNGGADFRIWVAGCASGEEAYSIYILANEAKRRLGFEGRIMMFATDAFKASIEKAGKGIFSEKQVQAMEPEIRDRYFQKWMQACYKVRPEIRENIVFAQHNFLSAAPFTNMDLVSCRNVLIYLKPEAQETALGSFSYALKDAGVLFLGASESLGKFESSYSVLSQKDKLFQKQSSLLDAKRWPKAQASALHKLEVPSDTVYATSVKISRDLLGAYDNLLERYGPCGFLINTSREVLHYFGNAADFCIHASGRANKELTSQLDDGLKLAVTALLHRAMQREGRVASLGLRCKSRSGDCVVDVSVSALGRLPAERRVFLVEIEERPKDAAARPAVAAADVEFNAEVEVGEQVKLLEDELRLTRENLEAANEELQVSNEELQATNEEMQVSNEELQSTNEELHSLNEELTTLNSEYGRKNDDLIHINLTHQNLLESSEDGILFVDRDLIIQQFNSAIRTAFQLLPSDIGRPLQHIAYRMEDAEPLLNTVSKVLKEGCRIESESSDIDGKRYLKRAFPFRDADQVIVGVLLTFTDITETRKLRDRFDFAIGAARLSWWDWDLESGELKVYSSGSCLLGEDCLCTQRDRTGWMELVHPSDREEVARGLDACLAGETEEWLCEHRFMSASGKWIWVENRGRVTRRDGDGRALEVIGTTQDIDSYKQTIIDLDSQKDILTVAGRMAKLGAWEYDVASGQVSWSDAMRDIHGVDADYDPNLEDALSFFPEPGRTQLKEAFQCALEEGHAYSLKLDFINQQGEHRFVRTACQVQRHKETQAVIGLVGVFQDVTDITIQENEVRAFFDLSPDFQATANRKGTLQTFSPTWTEELGYPDDVLQGMALEDFVDLEDRAGFSALLKDLKPQVPIQSYETRILNYDMKANPSLQPPAMWMAWSISYDENLDTLFVSARLVTEQKEANQALQEARVRAEEANRVKAEFLAVMSHELRTPLNPILGFTEILLEDAEEGEQREILHSIVDSGRHMLSLIDEILSFSKIDAGKVKVEPVEFSLADLVKSKLNLMSGQLKGKAIELSSEIEPGPFQQEGLPILVGDSGMLRQVLRNLIGNAIKFTDQGRVVLRAKVLEAAAGQALLRFEVEDTGIGIEAKHLRGLFDSFYQVDSSMTREFGGTGLGLTICERLVGLLGGEIKVTSECGAGSVFSFEIPLGYVGIEVGSGTDASAAVNGSGKKDLNLVSARVLVVEDNPQNAFYVERSLKNHNCHVTVAPRGEDALARIESEAFDLVLLDLHMPGIGGMETLIQLRAREAKGSGSRLPVVVLTADAFEKTTAECLQNGADEVLTKPVRQEALRSLLSQYIERQDGVPG